MVFVGFAEYTLWCCPPFLPPVSPLPQWDEVQVQVFREGGRDRNPDLGITHRWAVVWEEFSWVVDLKLPSVCSSVAGGVLSGCSSLTSRKHILTPEVSKRPCGIACSCTETEKTSTYLNYSALVVLFPPSRFPAGGVTAVCSPWKDRGSSASVPDASWKVCGLQHLKSPGV